MDNNDSNLKSQTGGLKLMTVFIAVLALHVVVIGGFTVYHLMSGGSADSDLSSTDKNHKSSTSDITTAEVTQTDKSTTTAPTEVATIPASTVTPASAPAPTGDTSSPASATTSTTTATTPAPETMTSAPIPTPTPAPATTAATPIATPALTLNPPATTAASANVNTTTVQPTAQTPTGPISPELAPPPDAAPVAISPMAPVISPTAPLAAGPVHMPPANADASLVHHAHQQTYVVKITDSYKKIAHAHHITVAQLKEANHIKGDTLHTGQKLLIPSEKSEVAEATSTLSSAPTSTVASESTAPMTTGLTSTTTSEATAEHHHMYTIQKGDTLTKIAHKFKTTPKALMAANDITNPTKLTIGKKLRIPSREARSASNTPPRATPPSQVQAKGNVTAPTGQLATFRP